MLRRLWQLTIRFRWPLTAALLTMALLWYLVQPRPDVVYQLPNTQGGTVRISPSGKYLLIHGQTSLLVYQLLIDEARLILDHPWHDPVESQFDLEDGIAFSTYASSTPTPDGTTLELWHWQQGQSEPKKVGSRKPFPPWHPREGHSSSDIFNGLFELDSHFLTHCCLSPNGLNWIIPVTNGTLIHFELVDARTGRSVRMDIPDVVIAKPYLSDLTVQFSSDGNELATANYVQAKNEDEVHSTLLLRWFDVQTGKVILSKELPSTMNFDRIRLLRKGKIVALSEGFSDLNMQLHADADGYKSLKLNESVADPQERPWPKQSDSLWKAYPECTSQIDESSRVLIYCWEHHLLPKSGGFSGVTPTIAGYYFGARDLNNGTLIHTERLPDRPRKPDDWKPEGWTMLDILPGAVLMLEEPKQELSPWQQKWETWRVKYFPWFPTFNHGHTRLQFIKTTTGKRLIELSLPFSVVSHFYLKQQQALYLVMAAYDEIVIQKYAYPLHKPWMLILTWTIGVFAGLVSLQWLSNKVPYRVRPVRDLGKIK